jgi:hypothetical protein
MRESDLVQKIRDWLVQNGALPFKYHGSVYGYKGHADIYGCFHDGRAFFLEVKMPGRKPNPHQTAFLKLAADHGAIVGWCDSLEGAKKLFGAHVRGS